MPPPRSRRSAPNAAGPARARRQLTRESGCRGWLELALGSRSDGPNYLRFGDLSVDVITNRFPVEGRSYLGGKIRFGRINPYLPALAGGTGAAAFAPHQFITSGPAPPMVGTYRWRRSLLPHSGPWAIRDALSSIRGSRLKSSPRELPTPTGRTAPQSHKPYNSDRLRNQIMGPVCQKPNPGRGLGVSVLQLQEPIRRSRPERAGAISG